MLVDSHCHLDRLDLSNYNGDLNLALAAAQNNGVKHFLCVCIDLDNFSAVLNIAKNYIQVYASVGIHPTEIVSNEPSANVLTQLALSDDKIIAIGETGLDYYREETQKELQQERFRNHIRAAKKVNKPLIVHTRQARHDTIQILKEEGAEQMGGVMHCFTEDLAMAKQAIELNFYISFSGIVTFKNATELQDIAKQIPLEKILIETDSPYLAPVPFRGKPNQPAYVKYVAEFIANLRGISFDEVAKITTENFFKLFNI